MYLNSLVVHCVNTFLFLKIPFSGGFIWYVTERAVYTTILFNVVFLTGTVITVIVLQAHQKTKRKPSCC